MDLWLDTPARLSVLLQGSLLNLVDIERLASAQAGKLGSPETQTDCGVPKLRFLPIGEPFTCVASRPGWPYEWKLNIRNPEGAVLFPTGFPVHPDALPDPLLARLEPLLRDPQRHVAGRDMEALISSHFMPDGDVKITAAHCPASMDLSDGHHEICTADVDGQLLRLQLDVANGFWRVRLQNQAILIMDRVERDAEASGAEMARRRGVPGVVLHVDCGAKRTEVVDYPVRKTCRVWNVQGPADGLA